MAEIKNVVFDLGGVLLDVDYQLTNDAFTRLGFDNFHEMYSQYTADEIFSRLETGKITPESFYEHMLKVAPGGILMQDITNSWNAMLLQFRKKTLDFLQELKNRYPLYLLSNTNAIHVPAFEKILQEQTGYASLDEFFVKAWFSHKIGLRKPNREAFDFILQDAGMRPEETVFIDDSYNNIDTASAMGFQAVLLQPGETVESLPIWK